jgi:hypothetical protein
MEALYNAQPHSGLGIDILNVFSPLIYLFNCAYTYYSQPWNSLIWLASSYFYQLTENDRTRTLTFGFGTCLLCIIDYYAVKALETYFWVIKFNLSFSSIVFVVFVLVLALEKDRTCPPLHVLEDITQNSGCL